MLVVASFIILPTKLINSSLACQVIFFLERILVGCWSKDVSKWETKPSFSSAGVAVKYYQQLAAILINNQWTSTVGV